MIGYGYFQFRAKLSESRLAFARHLRTTGRVTEDCPPLERRVDGRLAFARYLFVTGRLSDRCPDSGRPLPDGVVTVLDRRRGEP